MREELLKKINDEIEDVCTSKGIMMDEEWSIYLDLTELEREAFQSLELDPKYYWEFDDNNSLTISHAREDKPFINRELVIKCMLNNKSKDGEIYIVKNDKDGELDVVFMESGWIDSYCSQNQCEVVESFSFCPGDYGYKTDLELGSYEEGSYESEDAEEHLDRMDLDIII